MTECKSGQCGSSQSQDAPADDAAIAQSLSKIKHKYLVMSGKGGVGKSSVSVNLAMTLAGKGFKVGLMDVDIHGPDVPRMLGLTRSPHVNEDKKLVPVPYSDNLSAVSIEFLMPEKDNAIIWRGPMKFSAIKQFVGDTAWGDLDYLIIDAPPGTGDEPLTVAQTIKDAKAVIVTTPQEVALADVRKSINFCNVVKMEILGVIENMSGIVCPHCGQDFKMFGTGGGERTAQDLGLTFLGRIPFDPEIVACGDAGVSYLQKHKDSNVTKAFDEIAGKLIQKGFLAETKPASEPDQRRNGHMKFAIPLADGKLTAHFGHCKEFAIVYTEQNQIVKTEFEIPPPHEPGVLPKWLSEKGVNVVIAGGMGNRAIDLFNQAGIQVVTGAPVESPETLVMSYIENSLVSGDNLCSH